MGEAKLELSKSFFKGDVKRPRVASQEGNAKSQKSRSPKALARASLSRDAPSWRVPLDFFLKHATCEENHSGICRHMRARFLYGILRAFRWDFRKRNRTSRDENRYVSKARYVCVEIFV